MIVGMEDKMDNNISEMLGVFVKRVNELDRPAEWVSGASNYSASPEDFAVVKRAQVAETAESIFGAYPPIEYIEDILSYFKAKRDRIITDDIPTFLAENGLKKAILGDGTEVSTEEVLTTKTVDEAKMLDWVIANGGADLIKDTLAFGKGICDARLLEFLAENQYAYSHDSGVHSQTLKKFINDRYKEMGTDGLPPPDAIEARPFVRAKIKAPKV